jgi:hypothetical protein
MLKFRMGVGQTGLAVGLASLSLLIYMYSADREPCATGSLQRRAAGSNKRAETEASAAAAALACHPCRAPLAILRLTCPMRGRRNSTFGTQRGSPDGEESAAHPITDHPGLLCP